MEDTSRVAAVIVGVVTLHFGGGKKLVLRDCLYISGVRRNLVSVSYLSCNGYSLLFNKDFFLSNMKMILYVVGCY